MNIALWIVAVVLAVVFLAAGTMKATKSKEELGDNMAWAEDFSPGVIKLTGVLEILGALGLILPAVTGIAPVLVPLAALGLAITMLLAAMVHLRRGERDKLVGNGVLFLAAAFVAWGRFGGYAF